MFTSEIMPCFIVFECRLNKFMFSMHDHFITTSRLETLNYFLRADVLLRNTFTEER